MNENNSIAENIKYRKTYLKTLSRIASEKCLEGIHDCNVLIEDLEKAKAEGLDTLQYEFFKNFASCALVTLSVLTPLMRVTNHIVMHNIAKVYEKF